MIQDSGSVAGFPAGARMSPGRMRPEIPISPAEAERRKKRAARILSAHIPKLVEEAQVVVKGSLVWKNGPIPTNKGPIRIQVTFAGVRPEDALLYAMYLESN